LLSEDRRVLLVRLSYRGERWWAAPGGGLEDDETHEEAASREIAEETGFELDELGSWVWTREDVFRFEGRLYPRPRVIDAEEAKTFDGLRWWTPEELETADERFAPAKLPALVRKLVEEGPPERPITVGGPLRPWCAFASRSVYLSSERRDGLTNVTMPHWVVRGYQDIDPVTSGCRRADRAKKAPSEPADDQSRTPPSSSCVKSA
jgi:ADP-ribose pyrophosphatase YjhB (NUDIX family)